MIYVFLSHDVDWGRTGAPIPHILARKERFDEEILKHLQTRNPYYNFPDYMEIEEKFGVRSTFFFRTHVKDATGSPPPYDIAEYKEEVRSLLNGGWEIGLHLDPVSYKSVSKIQQEKKALENVANGPIYGNRVHYTLNDDALHHNLKKLSFKYDSSAKFCREKIMDADFGYFKTDGLVVFPITVMDALIFAYLAPSEDEVMNVIKDTVGKCRKLPKEKRIITIIWHDCALKMKKGRVYPQLLKYLTSLEDVEVKRGIDLFETVEKETLQC